MSEYLKDVVQSSMRKQDWKTHNSYTINTNLCYPNQNGNDENQVKVQENDNFRNNSGQGTSW